MSIQADQLGGSMFQGVRVFDPRPLFYGCHPEVRAAFVPKTPSRKHVAPGGGGFSAAHLRSESKKRGTSARSAPVPRVFAAFGTRTSGRRRSLPPFFRPPHASSIPPTPQAPLSAPQNTPALHPPVPASPCPRLPRAEARLAAWSSRPTRIPGNRQRPGRLR